MYCEAAEGGGGTFRTFVINNDSFHFQVGLSRQRLVVMALLLGSDYNPGGVAGIGRDGVAKLFSLWGAPNKQVG